MMFLLVLATALLSVPSSSQQFGKILHPQGFPSVPPKPGERIGDLDKQRVQLEEEVRNLSQIVTRLESQCTPVKESPFSKCRVSNDCDSFTNAHCHNGVCRCDIGFAIDRTICRPLTECNKTSSVTQRYQGRAINGYNIGKVGKLTPNSCQQLCIDNPRCKTVDFHIHDHYCFPSDMTWLDVPEGKRVISANYDYYQRDCEW